MSEQDDWRLRGQETYLKGATLQHMRYRQNPENPDWDHDHCAFCWQEFCTDVTCDSLKAGYCTEDEYYWICPQCFEDFKDRFGWRVVEANSD